MGFHPTPDKMAKIKKITNNNAGKGVEKGHLLTFGGTENQLSQYGNHCREFTECYKKIAACLNSTMYYAFHREQIIASQI